MIEFDLRMNKVQRVIFILTLTALVAWMACIPWVASLGFSKTGMVLTFAGITALGVSGLTLTGKLWSAGANQMTARQRTLALVITREDTMAAKHRWIPLSISLLAFPVQLCTAASSESQSDLPTNYVAELLTALFTLAILVFAYRWLTGNLAKIDEIRNDVKEIKRAVIQDHDSDTKDDE